MFTFRKTVENLHPEIETIFPPDCILGLTSALDLVYRVSGKMYPQLFDF